jgi:putative transposase
MMGLGGIITMGSRRRHTPEQIIRKLREGEKLIGQGALAVVCRQLEVSEATWQRWVAQYGGMKADDAKRLKDLERENARLKKIVADQLLDIDMLKELNRGNRSRASPPRCGGAAAALRGIPTTCLPGSRAAPLGPAPPRQVCSGRREGAAGQAAADLDRASTVGVA